MSPDLEVTTAVYRAIRLGLLPLSLAEFEQELAVLTPAQREDYIQDLWDRL